MTKLRVVVLLFLGTLLFSSEDVSAQSYDQNWSVGFDFMGNILQGDFTSHPLFFSGDLFARWDIFPNSSIYAVGSFGELKTGLDANELLARPGYPDKIRTDYSSFELYAGVHLQSAGFQPELFLGGEFLHFDPESATAAPLPVIANYDKNVFAFLLGIGFEFPIGDKGLSFNAKAMMHFSSSKYLDNFPSESRDAFLTFGGGFTYTFGNSNNPISGSPTKDTAKKSWDGKIDSDGDGISDDDEINKYHTDPHKADTDGDGLTDFQEIFIYRTDPNKPDTDSDGLYDGEEVNKYHTDPLSWDSDGDGLSDGYEVNISHTNPKNHDTDGDGIWDKLDKCPLVKGVPPDGCPPK